MDRWKDKQTDWLVDINITYICIFKKKQSLQNSGIYHADSQIQEKAW